MKIVFILCVFSVILTACGDKKSESEQITSAQKETYNLLTDSKEILDEAEQAAKLLEDASKKTMEELESY